MNAHNVSERVHSRGARDDQPSAFSLRSGPELWKHDVLAEDKDEKDVAGRQSPCLPDASASSPLLVEGPGDLAAEASVRRDHERVGAVSSYARCPMRRALIVACVALASCSDDGETATGSGGSTSSPEGSGAASGWPGADAGGSDAGADFHELLARRYIKIRSMRGLDEVYELYELLGRNAEGDYLHVVYRAVPWPG
jgi:hypothetical protein